MKKAPLIRNPVLVAALSLGAYLTSTNAQNVIFTEDWETDHSLDGTYITNSVGGVNYANLFFDYSTAGIPQSPNSTGASTRAPENGGKPCGRVNLSGRH